MPLTNGFAASLVKRTVKKPVLMSDKKTQKRDPKTKVPLFKDELTSIQEDEVMDFKLRGKVLTVVTTSGEKLTAQLSDAELEKTTAVPAE